MYKPHPSFDMPPDETPIWRYMDLDKFVSLVSRPALYFSAAAGLGDPYEGALPKRDIQERERVLGTGTSPGGITGSEMVSNIRRTSLRAVIINCWTMAEDEEAFMWGLYGNKVAIRSTAGRLRDSITDSQLLFHIGRVRYIDYERAWLGDGKWLAPYVHKRATYEVERELRAVALRPLDPDWPEGGHTVSGDHLLTRAGQEGVALDDGYPGRFVEVGLNRLIVEVVVAPGSRRGLLEDVRRTVRAFQFGATVRPSSLDEPPGY